MNRTKRQRVFDGLIHWSIAGAIASVIVTFAIESAVKASGAIPVPVSVAKAHADTECGDLECYRELRKRLVEIEHRLDRVEPTRAGAPSK